MTKITVVGYPRSGTTWITRLLSDLLDSPIRGQEIDTNHCQTGKGGYVIRKTHLQAHEWNGDGKVVFIQRDPRDVAVSAMFYLGFEPTDNNLMSTIWEMVRVEHENEIRKEYQIYHRDGTSGDYENWINEWMPQDDIFKLKYEWLHEHPFPILMRLLTYCIGKIPSTEMPLEVRRSRVSTAIERQRFGRHKSTHPHSLRRGIVGDWQNYFKQEHGGFITARLAKFMLRQGYIDSFDWWKEL